MKQRVKSGIFKAGQQEESQDVLVEAVRKSQLVAANGFDYRKLGRKQDGLLPCVVEERKEELEFTYDIHGVTSWTAIRKERRELWIAALADVGRLWQAAQHYCFSLEPRNLYYDIQGRVFVKSRDVYGAGDACSTKHCSMEYFLEQYKALAGCTLTKKYKFEDYLNGGDDLLWEDSFLAELAECTKVAQAVGLLQEEYQAYRQEHQKKYVEVARSKNIMQKLTLAVTCVAAVVSLSEFGYMAVWERPYQRAAVAANEAYLKSDYAAAVEAMEAVAVARMNICQKYILATACVKCEGFSDAEQRNILNTISLNGDEKIMEYWIYINRLETDAAADIAMQQSSNQLLYYAYLKEKAVVENSASLTGQEKSDRLSAIENKLKPLVEEYHALMEESTIRKP